MARRTFFALLAIFSWFFAIFWWRRRIFRWVTTVFWSCGWPRGAGELFGVAEVFSGWRRGFSDEAAGNVLLGGAPGASSLLLNTKASQEAACSRAPATIVPGPEPELHGAGVSRFGENGSHPAAADFSDEPEAVLWRRPPIAPYRIRPSVVRGGLAGQFGTENGPVVYARFILAPGPHAAVAAAQVRRKAGRSVAGGCGTGRAVADKCLIMSEIMICPVGFCRQVKCSFA